MSTHSCARARTTFISKTSIGRILYRTQTDKHCTVADGLLGKQVSVTGVTTNYINYIMSRCFSERRHFINNNLYRRKSFNSFFMQFLTRTLLLLIFKKLKKIYTICPSLLSTHLKHFNITSQMVCLVRNL